MEFLEEKKKQLPQKYLELPNGLCALLVQDSQGNQTKGAAAISVGVGSSADPDDAYGLAHLLEHLLSMGTKSFPGEGEYETYIEEHGGSSNAVTLFDQTIHSFDVGKRFFKDALGRFAEYISAPLLREETIERELWSIDAEFMEKFLDDEYRLEQLQCYTCPKPHLFNRFMFGNMKSLGNHAMSGLRDRVLRFYHDYYHGKVMKLIVMGTESLDTLQEWVEELFGKIDKGHAIEPPRPLKFPIWTPGKIYKLDTYSNHHMLHLSWAFPLSQYTCQRKVNEYVSYLLGYEGKGSLIALLRAKGWAFEIDTAPDETPTFGYSAYFFCFKIRLTGSGLTKVLDIIGHVYHYINILRSQRRKKSILKELQDAALLKCLLETPEFAQDYVEDLAEKLFLYPNEYVVTGDYEFETLDEKSVKEFLNFLRPEYMRVDLVTKFLQKQLEEKIRKRQKLVDIHHDDMFGLSYIEEDIPADLSQAWDDELNLPSKNSFAVSLEECRPAFAHEELDEPACAADDLSHACVDENLSAEELSKPKCFADEPSEPSSSDSSSASVESDSTDDESDEFILCDDSKMKFSYSYETHILPQVSITLGISLRGGGYRSPMDALLMELFLVMLKRELGEIIYKATIARINVSFELCADSLELKIDCVTHKLCDILSTILTTMISFLPDHDGFRVSLEYLERTLKDKNSSPQEYSEYLMEQILYKEFWTVDSKLQILKDKNLFHRLTEFIPYLLSKVYIETHCNGNLSKAEANKILKLLRDIFANNQPLSNAKRYKQCVLLLPRGANYVLSRMAKHPRERNSMINMHFQVGPNEMRSYALANLFDKVVAPAFFQKLRAVEQLGYSVESSIWLECGMLGYQFKVVSFRFNPEQVLERIESFIQEIPGILHNKRSSLKDYRRDLKNELLQVDESQFPSSGIMSSRCKRKLANSITIEDVTKWYEKYIRTREPSPDCKRITVCVHGSQTGEKKVDNSSRNVIKSISGFKNHSQFYTL